MLCRLAVAVALSACPAVAFAQVHAIGGRGIDNTLTVFQMP
jgi:hypothetical protein